jgi:hypothetical protein
MTAVNCILWNNTPQQIGGLDNGSINIIYSSIQDGWPGVGNIDMDPLFYSKPIRGYEYLLTPDSPCIDTGDPRIEDRLFDRHPEWPGWYPDGARSDMGAYGGPYNRNWIR